MNLPAAAVRLGVAVMIASAVAFTTAHARNPPSLPEPFDSSAIDHGANACTNFFQYATGRWRASHPIPSAYSEYGYIEELVDRTRDIVRATLTDAQRHPGLPPSVPYKIGTFYGTCMDTAQIRSIGVRPLEPELTRIAAVKTRAAIADELARLNAIGVDAGFDLEAMQDFRQSTQVIAAINQGGLGLPERDYYLRRDSASEKIRTQYARHVARMLALAGDDASAADAARILAFETQLARGSLPAATLRDPAAVYHPMTLERASKLAPHIALASYLHDEHVVTPNRLNVAEPMFLSSLDTLAHTAPVASWRAYMRWRLLDAYAPTLPPAFENEEFAFVGGVLRGTVVQLPRWKRCVEATNDALGMAVGQAYVARMFPPSAKAHAHDMVDRIRTAYREELTSLRWMSPGTKRYALYKLGVMGLKVGYPSRWRSYAGYTVDTDSYAANVARGRAFNRRYELAKIGKPVDRSAWFMTPQTVNAYNDTQRNEIVLPAAQLQLPFYDPAGDDAANLSATGGGTVGHEMTHGFDDEGHKFDAQGNVRNWWTPADLAHFDARANCVIRQFDRTTAIGNVHYQGHLVAGEAIADLGGVVIGYRALEDSLAGESRAAIDGFTPEQRYFLGFAQSWTESVRPAAAKLEALTDPHPLPRDRVNATVANIPAWYTAFGCAPPPRPLCRVW